MSMNKVYLHGHVGKVPEEKTTTSGIKFARFSFATTESWKDPQGQKQSKTEWHSIIAWGKIGERVMRGVDKKGKELLLEGKIEYTTKDDPNNAGKKITYTNIKLIDFQFCGKRDGNNDVPDPDLGREAYNSNSEEPLSDNSNVDDDIPF